MGENTNETKKRLINLVKEYPDLKRGEMFVEITEEDLTYNKIDKTNSISIICNCKYIRISEKISF